MRVTKSLAALASGALLAGLALVAVAAPASASDEGAVLPGGIYWFNVYGPLASQSAATQIKTGTNAATGGNLGTGRPWATLTTENACPAGTANITTSIRIPQVGVPENDWAQVQVGALAADKDADGRFYTVTAIQADRLNKSEILTYNAANGGSGVYPFITVCRDAAAQSLGYFATAITMTGTTQTGLSWSIVSPTVTGGGGAQAAATTTTLAAALSGADVVLTAAVAPAAAGTVTFKEGATTLGTAPVAAGSASFTVTAPAQGNHSYTADFAPTDTAAYLASQGAISLTLGLDAKTGQLVLTVPAAPVVDGSLTFSVPFDTPVSLAGSRDGANTRVVASGAFPAVTVTDTRRDGLLTGWEVNAQASEFTGTGGTVSAKYLGWVPATPTMTPDAGSPLVAQAGPTVGSFLDNAASAGLGASSLLGKAATPGRGVSTLNAQLNLAIPAATSAGTYTSTVTVTLVSN